MKLPVFTAARSNIAAEATSKQCCEDPGARRVNSFAPHEQGHGDEQDDR